MISAISLPLILMIFYHKTLALVPNAYGVFDTSPSFQISLVPSLPNSPFAGGKNVELLITHFPFTSNSTLGGILIPKVRLTFHLIILNILYLLLFLLNM